MLKKIDEMLEEIEKEMEDVSLEVLIGANILMILLLTRISMGV